MAQCPPPPKYASGAISLVNDQIQTVVEGVQRVCIYHRHADEQKLSTV